MQIKIYKSPQGWTAKSYREIDGKLWQIKTSKSVAGKIVSKASQGTLVETGKRMGFQMIRPPLSLWNEPLHECEARATKNNIRETHQQGISALESREAFLKLLQAMITKKDLKSLNLKTLEDYYELVAKLIEEEEEATAKKKLYALNITQVQYCYEDFLNRTRHFTRMADLAFDALEQKIQQR